MEERAGEAVLLLFQRHGPIRLVQKPMLMRYTKHRSPLNNHHHTHLKK